MNSLYVSLRLGKELASICERSLMVERSAGRRSKVELKANGEYLNLKILGEDLGALRSAANTYLRWASMLQELLG